MPFEPRRWMIVALSVAWAILTLWLLWQSASAAVRVSEYSFRRLMTGPGYLVAQQLQPLSTEQREERLQTLRQYFQYPVTLVEKDSVELPPQASIMLSHQQAAQGSDEEIAYYQLDKDTLIQFGPMWGSAAMEDVLRTPIYLWTALASSAPLLFLSLAAWKRRRARQTDMDAIVASLRQLVRSPAGMLPAVGKEWRPLLLSLQKHAEEIAAMSDRHKEVSQAVSHELRTPLARMRFALVLLGRSDDPVTRTRLQERLQTDIEELESLVRASLTFARLADAPARLLREPIAIQDWLQKECSGLADHSHFLEISVEPTALEIVGDRALMHLFTRNLLGNAVAHARSRVKISAWRHDPDHMALVVEDDGPGIAVEDRERIFEPFVRLQAGTSEHAGFGLGLALVKRAVHWHRGEISITQSPLGGARFQVTIPLRLT